MARPANSELDDALMRERLAAAALELFRDSGLEGVSLRKLAVHFGVSHTMLYRYFDSKEALFTAVRLASLSVLYGRLHAVDDERAAPVLRIREAAQALIRFGLDYSREYRFLFSAEQPALEDNQELLRMRHKVFDHIVDIAKAAQAQQIITMEARTWVHMAWALLHGLLMLHESNQLLEGRKFNELVNAALEVLLGSTGAPAAKSMRKKQVS